MKVPNYRKHCLVAFIAITSTIAVFSQESPAQTRKPAIEYSSLLNAFTVKFRGERGQGKTGGYLVLNQKHEIMGVFFPENAKLDCQLVKSGSDQAIYKADCTLRKAGGVFTMISAGKNEGYTFKEEGDYELRFLLNGEVITRLPFNVFFKKQDDDFDPRIYTYVDGDWSSLSYLSFASDKDVSPLKFNTWTRKVVMTTTPEPSKMTVTLMQGDEVVAVTPPGTIAWPEWQTREVTFSFPTNQGGKVFNNKDLLKRSGSHTVRVDVDGKPHQYFNFEVSDGKIIGHDRQAMGYSPRADWLCPRKIRLGLEATSHVFWMERANAAAASEPNSNPSASTSNVTKNPNWVVESKIDPNRPFEIVNTNIRMRKDMPYSIGDGIVAYATGGRGVGYFVVGEDKPRSIENGQSFRGDLFFACGKLIMMATRNNVTVYSTEVERSVEIPADEIFLNYQTHSLYGPRMADADGRLVATVNEPSKLKSKSIINVIDLSGDNKPIVIPIKNADFELRDVTSVKVNASAGTVAVGSKRKGAIYVANISPNSKFKKYDISGFDSFGEADMVLTKKTILYTDAAGFANVRMLDLKTGEVTMPESSQYGGGWGPVGDSNGSLFAWAIKEPRNSWAIGGVDAMPLDNSGAKSPLGNYGALGEGRSMAMATDGTVFIAGTRSISESNCLQAKSNGKWQMVVGPEGNPVPAIDVIAENSIIVFKTGKPSTSSEVKLSYATHGTKVKLPSAATGSVSDGARPNGSTKNGTVAKQVADSNPHVSTSDIDKAFLAEIINNEKTIYEALKSSLSEEEARKRSRDAGLNALKASGREHLIEAYKKTWK